MASFLSSIYRNGLLKDEVVIITGAGQGIGRSTALLFAREGAKIVVSDINAALANAVVEEIRNGGGEAVAVAGDICADEFPKNAVDAAVSNFGKINHIINNAGFPLRHLIKDMPDDAFDIMYDVHVRASFRLIRQAAPYFLFEDESKRENRSVINVSSVIGLHGDMLCANYASAKAAVIGLTKSLAKEWGPFGVRANTAAFGMILTRLSSTDVKDTTIESHGKTLELKLVQTPKVLDGIAESTPLRRGGTADEAAASLLYLCSPLASFVSGHTLEVTGGYQI